MGIGFRLGSLETNWREAFVTLLLIGINVLMFLLTEMQGASSYDLELMVRMGAMYAPYVVENGEYYRILTSAFLHFGMSHLLGNMLGLLLMGRVVEKEFGHIKFLVFYLACILLEGGVSCLWYWFSDPYVVSAGASGGVYAVNGALLYMTLQNRGKFSRVRLNVRWVFFMTFYSLAVGFTTPGTGNVAHLSGLIFGFLLSVLCYYPNGRIPGEQREADQDERKDGMEEGLGARESLKKLTGWSLEDARFQWKEQCDPKPYAQELLYRLNHASNRLKGQEWGVKLLAPAFDLGAMELVGKLLSQINPLALKGEYRCEYYRCQAAYGWFTRDESLLEEAAAEYRDLPDRIGFGKMNKEEWEQGLGIVEWFKTAYINDILGMQEALDRQGSPSECRMDQVVKSFMIGYTWMKAGDEERAEDFFQYVIQYGNKTWYAGFLEKRKKQAQEESHE